MLLHEKLKVDVIGFACGIVVSLLLPLLMHWNPELLQLLLRRVAYENRDYPDFILQVCQFKVQYKVAYQYRKPFFLLLIVVLSFRTEKMLQTLL